MVRLSQCTPSAKADGEHDFLRGSLPTRARGRAQLDEVRFAGVAGKPGVRAEAAIGGTEGF